MQSTEAKPTTIEALFEQCKEDLIAYPSSERRLLAIKYGRDNVMHAHDQNFGDLISRMSGKQFVEFMRILVANILERRALN